MSCVSRQCVKRYFNKDQLLTVKKIAVFPFCGINGDFVADSITQCLGMKFHDIEIIEQTKVLQLMEELDLDANAVWKMKKEALARIGRILGVEGVVIGRVEWFTRDAYGHYPSEYYGYYGRDPGKYYGIFPYDYWGTCTYFTIRMKMIHSETGKTVLHLETIEPKYYLSYQVDKLCEDINNL